MDLIEWKMMILHLAFITIQLLNTKALFEIPNFMQNIVKS